MSTRQFVAARCTSKAVSMITEAKKLTLRSLRLAKNTAPAPNMMMSASAEGRRERNTLICPKGSDNAAMHHWKNGGL